MNPNRLWIAPTNDLEALEIRDILTNARETLLITAQPWGATWSNLEPPVVHSIQSFRAASPESLIYGIELAGPNPFGATNVDHHIYPGDDRRSPLTSLEQVAAILGVTLTRDQTLVAINDRSWTPGLLEAGATPEQIRSIRARDRQAQGVTKADEDRAAHDLDSARQVSGLWLVPCPGGPISAHSDLLFDRTGRIEPFLLMSPQEWSYSGPQASQLAAIGFPESHWSGGSPDCGYFGIGNPSLPSRLRILKILNQPPIPTACSLENRGAQYC